MPTKEQLRELVRAGRSYEDIGRLHGIPPGQAYMIVTGLPADGSTTVGPEALREIEGILPGSSQHLSNPPAATPEGDQGVLAWLKSRAVSDSQMQQAAAARTAEPPPVQGADETNDVISAIGWDHNQLKYLLEQLEAIPGTRKGGRVDQQHQRASIVDMIRVRLSEHETLEEEYFWPAVRELLPGGDALADRAMEQDRQANEHLQQMRGEAGTEDSFDEHVEKFSLLLRKHVAFEDHVLLEFARTVPEDRRREIGHSYLQGKRHGTSGPAAQRRQIDTGHAAPPARGAPAPNGPARNGPARNGKAGTSEP
ncbi:MAG TPA: hemerythrin domain-containing protein [Acidimicrobiales bacterium]|nr:hemerythrin domain-containing protein [Acidimicrobiales bacterium]